MAITLQEIVVKLEADIKQYKSALKDAQSNTKSSTDSIKSSFDSVSGGISSAIGNLASLKGAIIGVVAGGFVGLIKNALDSADAIGVLAEKTGVSTDFLQGMAHAANQSNVETESLNGGLGIFTKIIGDAVTGTDGAKKAFSDLGVSLTDGHGNLKTTEELFYDVSDSIASLKTPAEQAARAQDLFGRSGKDLVPLLNEGSSAIKTMQKEARDLGLILDNELIKAADKTNDKIATMSMAISTQFNASLLQLIPVIQPVITAVTGLAYAISTVGIGWKALLGGGQGANKMQEEVIKLKDGITFVNTAIRQVSLSNITTDEKNAKLAELNKLLAEKRQTLEDIFKKENEGGGKNGQGVPPPVKTLEQKQAENAAELELLLQHNENMRAINAEYYQYDIADNETRILSKLNAKALGDTKYLALQAKLIADDKKKTEEASEKEAKTDKETKEDRKKALSTLASYQAGKQKEMAIVSKGAAIAQATIATYTAATEAYKAMAGIPIVGPALGIAAAAAAIASGLAQVSSISGVDTGFAMGADMVPGSGSRDSVAAWVQPKERIVPRDTNMLLEQWLQYQKRNGFGNSGGTAKVEIVLKDDLINFIDARLVERERMSIGMS